MAARPKFLEDFREELHAIGLATFAKHRKCPVLVGVGVCGQAEDLKRLPERTTAMLKLGAGELSPAEVLVGRTWLVRKDPDGPLVKGVTVGRSGKNDIIIPEFSISDRHCEFIVEAKRTVIIDRESLNGTYLGDEQLAPNAPHVVNDGTMIRLGRYQFEFLTTESFIQRLKVRR